MKVFVADSGAVYDNLGLGHSMSCCGEKCQIWQEKCYTLSRMLLRPAFGGLSYPTRK